VSNLSDIQKLILWARKQSIAWQTLTVGTITIDGSDMRQLESMPQPKALVPAKRPDVYAKYGQAMLEQAADSDGIDEATSVVELDD
jgi:hypothetical protein